jgi:hypothetical protein
MRDEHRAVLARLARQQLAALPDDGNNTEPPETQTQGEDHERSLHDTARGLPEREREGSQSRQASRSPHAPNRLPHRPTVEEVPDEDDPFRDLVSYRLPFRSMTICCSI